ncbi:hypothetical protein WICPIJ_005050 [Wickerhamomyces pijperi]|uniref:EKC/KEOPS complex subunit GON7 n=1 Tax=Wickerhamomyces pijperi TaxID=599730 RepID=A0A9P8TMB7_WICPI|nr:hypothetical protein WICPIJ_005050 [Wickerhamomyces pijperi]
MPSATYSSPSDTQTFQTSHLQKSQLTTQGKTSGPSEFVKVDRDQPSEPADNYYGDLRCKLTYLQDELNTLLTDKMQAEKKSKDMEEAEKKLLDGDDGDDDE